MGKTVRFGLAGVLILVIGRLGAAGRLPRNPIAGVRLPSTLRSDEAWIAGHKAAAAALTAAGIGPIVLAAIAASSARGRRAQSGLLRIGGLWLVAGIGLATVQANRAATTAGLRAPLNVR